MRFSSMYYIIKPNFYLQGWKGVGRWNSWTVTQCCSICPSKIGGGPPTYKKLEVCMRTIKIILRKKKSFPLLITESNHLSLQASVSCSRSSGSRPKCCSSPAPFFNLSVKGRKRTDHCWLCIGRDILGEPSPISTGWRGMWHYTEIQIYT